MIVLFDINFHLAPCGGTFYTPTGTVSSPNYPNRYPNNNDCYYNIIAPTGIQIHLNFLSFNLEFHYTCSYDWLQVGQCRLTV